MGHFVSMMYATSLARKSVVFISLVGLTIGFAPPGQPQTAKNSGAEKSIRVDDPVEDFALRDLMAKSPEEFRLSGMKGKKHTVLFFFSEKCGHSKKYAGRVREFVKENLGDELAFCGVRSNEDDTPGSIRRFARSLKFDFPVLDDPEGRLARYFRVRVAPTFVVIDKEGILRYFGPFDNDGGHSFGPSAFFLADAVRAIRSDEPVAVKRALPFG
jgi:peroxiredoxin